MNGLKRAWGIVSPMVIFLVIQRVISFSAAFTFMNSKVDAAEILSDKQIMELQINAAEMLSNNIVLMSGIAAILSIPIFYRALNKEWMKRPYRILPISGPFRRYIYVILSAVGMTMAFNLAVNAFELFRLCSAGQGNLFGTVVYAGRGHRLFYAGRRGIDVSWSYL